MWTRLEPFGGLVVALLAVPPRIVGLREWWLNPDEGTYYAIITRTTGAWHDIMENAHPPLYYLLMRLVGFATHDFFWYRALSVACGVVAAYAVWLAARELAGPGVRGAAAGLVAGLIVAFSPTAIELSMVVRPYMLQLGLLALSLWLLLRYIGTGSRRALAWYVALLSLAVLTHYSSMLAMGAFVLMAVQQGIERRWAVQEWRRVALAHAVPGMLLIGLYYFHMRHLVGSTLVDANLDGWLNRYMIHAPGEAWVALMGSLRLLGEPWLIGPLAVFFLTALGVAAVKGDLRPVALGAGSLGIGIMVAVIGAYPFGSSRHSVWLMATVPPVLGWLGAQVMSLPRRKAVLAMGAVITVMLVGDTLGIWMGRLRVPSTAPERLLTAADMATMRDLLDPEALPPLVMSRQTFHLLVPLLPPAWASATFATDSSVSHFLWGERDVLTGWGWDLRAVEVQGGDTSYLLDMLRWAESELSISELQEDATALVMAGGWEVPVVADLVDLTGAEPLILGTRRVPGLVALLVDVDAYRRAAARTRPPAG
ncbi:MAG TPA: glycosyltransferase family 39 protein [Longimicrobiales bacterium]|nr:glycosyltransferase family 39 protein [Longimicrobiales bacterium]